MSLGAFTAEVQGTVSENLTGTARFEFYGGTNTCTIILDGSMYSNGITVNTGDMPRPGMGTMTGMSATYLDHRSAVIGYSGGGSLTITTSKSGELAGSMTFSAHQTYPTEDGAKTVSMTGTFRATPGSSPCS